MRVDDAQISRLIAELRQTSGSGPPASPPRPATTGGPHPLEPRVAALEAHLEHLRTDLGKLGDVPVKIGILEERVTHLPTKGWMVSALLSALAVIAALIAFSEKLHAFPR